MLSDVCPYFKALLDFIRKRESGLSFIMLLRQYNLEAVSVYFPFARLFREVLLSVLLSGLLQVRLLAMHLRYDQFFGNDGMLYLKETLRLSINTVLEIKLLNMVITNVMTQEPVCNHHG